MAEMAIPVLPMLFLPMRGCGRSNGCPRDEAASFSPVNLPVKPRTRQTGVIRGNAARLGTLAWALRPLGQLPARSPNLDSVLAHELLERARFEGIVLEPVIFNLTDLNVGLWDQHPNSASILHDNQALHTTICSNG